MLSYVSETTGQPKRVPDEIIRVLLAEPDTGYPCARGRLKP